MPLVISKVNYEDKDLDCFLDDNPLNGLLYENLYRINDALDFDRIFNEAYKICIRVYAEKHPERNCLVRFGLSSDSFQDDVRIYSWHCAITMLKLNYELFKRDGGYGGGREVYLFITKVWEFLPERCGFMKKCINIIVNHFRCHDEIFYVSYVEKKYDFKYEKINFASQIENVCDFVHIQCLTRSFTQIGVLTLIECLENPIEKMKLLDYIERIYKQYCMNNKEMNKRKTILPF